MNWLQGYAYRTPFSFLMFIAAGAATIGIALLTVGLQAMKAAMANKRPVTPVTGPMAVK